MNIHRLIRVFAIITSFGTYLILLMGAVVTQTGSGEGCGNSWPFCHGQIIPGTITVAELIEYGHRVMASVDSTLIITLTVVTWFLYKQDFRVKLFGAMSVFFVLLQGALGALTVIYERTFALSWLLSVHFGFSLIAFASVALLTVRLFQIAQEQRHGPATSSINLRKLQYPVWGLAVYTYIVVYTGALVEHTGAIEGCGYQLPGCGSNYFPSFTSLAGIQLLHRYVAGLLWFLILALLIVVLRFYRERRDLVRGAWWAFILVTLQAASGMAAVLTTGQLLAALTHTTIIAVFYAILCYLCMQVGWPWKRKQVGQSTESQQLKLHTVS